MADRALDVRAEDLQIVLNLLAKDHARLKVRYPFYDMQLLRYDANRGTLKDAASRDAFEAARDRHVPDDEFLDGDMPAWQDLGDACLSAGILPYDNQQEILDDLEDVWEEASDPRGQPVFLGFDTNVLYDRLASRRLPHDFLDDRFYQVPCVVSHGVREELDRQANRKYRSETVDTLRRAVAAGKLAGALSNRPIKKARKANAALGDVNYLTRHLRAAEADAGELPGGEDNDRLIAKSYQQFSQDRHARIVLLTADHGMQTNAQNARLDTVFLETPSFSGLDTGSLDERHLCYLLHDLAVRFQLLELEGINFRLWGDWSGKTPEDWMEDVVRIEHTGSRFAERFERDLTAARAVEKAVTESPGR